MTIKINDRLRLKVKKLVEFSEYFDPKIWRTWRWFTYYRLFGAFFLIVDRSG